ncbi:MAG TPA: ABC transporter permease [Candidatus Microsaccharimonas sp.]|nr:ABC transporter permease [Candidatus Microsaccharimonas sp.]
MRSLTRENLRNARKVIQTHRGRSYMTMLGIVIGIASVVTVASIGEGIKHQVVGQVNHAGDTLITVRPGADLSVHGSLRSLIAPRATGSLSAKDAMAVSHTAHVSLSTPLALVTGTLTANHGSYTAGPVVGVGNDLPRLVNQTVAYGAFFTDDDAGQNVAVLGAHAAQTLFDSEVPLGQTFTFRGKQFIVDGVLNEFPTVALSSDISYNDAVFIPYSTARLLTDNSVQPYEVLAKADSKQSVDAAVQSVNATLLKNHGGTKDFSVLKASDDLAATNSVLNLLTELTMIAAGISLFVGGIGIMNITLVSVTERLHEIGIRKAVGATNRQILNEFVAEAVVLSVFGAIAGIIVSLAINLVLRIMTNIAPVVQWQVLVGATLVSVCIGILFGSVPALKAARKDPIAALRGE